MRKVRREDREISTTAAKAILENGEYGILSTVGPDGQPYGIPLSYSYHDDAIYIHCATEGHKLDNIAANPRVSFCVVGRTRVLPDRFATEYESAIAFGTACEVQGDERYVALVSLLEKYSAQHIEAGKAYIDQLDRVTKVVKLTVERISGKARR